MGVLTVSDGEQADLCIINTCSVTGVADHKCRQMIKRCIKTHPHAFIVVTGCYAQLESQTISAMDGVNLVLGSNEKAHLIQYLSDAWSSSENREAHAESHTVTLKEIKTFAPACSRGNRTRYFLKVQDGCDYFCTYCTIPMARGFSRNPTIASLVEQAQNAAQEGGKEIVITGVNIGQFGKTTDETLLQLLQELDKVEGIKRYRISSIEPNLLTDEIIRFCASSRAFMPHFHIPLQSGSDQVLKLMHRRYDTAFFAHKINTIKQIIPHAFIGVDVMVGARGETPECFEETYELLSGLDISSLHVFPYSERPGTAALRIPYVVDEKDKKIRSKRLLELSDQKTRAFYEAYIGQEREVLLEKTGNKKMMQGFTDNYIRIQLPVKLDNESLDNRIVKTRLTGFNLTHTALKAEML